MYAIRSYYAQDVLRGLKRQSLAKLRKEVEPVEAEALARFLPAWQGLTQPRRGLDGEPWESWSFGLELSL